MFERALHLNWINYNYFTPTTLFRFIFIFVLRFRIWRGFGSFVFIGLNATIHFYDVATAPTHTHARTHKCTQRQTMHRRQESMYTMTGLYSENVDDNSSIDVPGDSETSENGSQIGGLAGNAVPNYVAADTVIKCHSRQPSASIVDQRDKQTTECNDTDEMSVDCGILTCRPKSFQKFARIKVSRRTCKQTNKQPSTASSCVLTFRIDWLINCNCVFYFFDSICVC